jgi:hypothetical protein
LRPGARPDAREALVRAFTDAQAAGDAELMERAALRLPSALGFGTHPGQLPVLIHQAYAVAAAPASRCRLASALARAWAYEGDADRAAAFATEAVHLADRIGDPELLASALDAALLGRWGPDDFQVRLTLADRLAHTAAHLTEPDQRLSAHVWRLTTAWECLDLVAVQRQLRALDLLAEESASPRITFFATSRRAMHALVTGDLELADRLIARTQEVGAATTEPDLAAVVHSLVADRARQVGDIATLRREAADFQEFGAAEGVQSVSAEAAVMWLAAGEPDRALDLLDQLAGGGLDRVPRDVDFLLTVTSLVEVATALRRRHLAADGARLLTPYAGRAVLNAGSVTFHGVVDHYLYLAERTLGRQSPARWQHSATNCYRRIGATWWTNRLGEPETPPPLAVIVHLHQEPSTGWTVGRDGATTTLLDLKGLHYLRYLLGRPGTDVGALELVAAISGIGIAPAETNPADLLDKQALSAYRQRLRDIDSDLAEAESWANRGRVEQLTIEREALIAELAGGMGLARRHRQFASNTERARVAVRKAIAATLRRIERHDPSLARLLRDTIHTGAACRYDPDPARPVTWLVEALPTPT